MTELTIPLFPLKAVLFPRGLLPLRIFEPRYLDLVSRCVKEEADFGVVLIRKGHEVGKAAEPYPVGTVVRIQDWDMSDDGLLEIVVCGSQRFRILNMKVQRNQLGIGRVTLLPNDEECPVPYELQSLAQGLGRILDQIGKPYAGMPRYMDDAGWVGGRLAEVLPIALDLKQELLELDDPEERLERINDWVIENQGDE